MTVSSREWRGGRGRGRGELCFKVRQPAMSSTRPVNASASQKCQKKKCSAIKLRPEGRANKWPDIIALAIEINFHLCNCKLPIAMIQPPPPPTHCTLHPRVGLLSLVFTQREVRSAQRSAADIHNSSFLSTALRHRQLYRLFPHTHTYTCIDLIEGAPRSPLSHW